MPTSQEKLKSRLDDIVKMRTIIHPNDLKDESLLMMKRWFDYRFISPLEATRQFGELYVAGLRRHVHRHVDVELAKTVSGTKTDVPTERTRWFTALWRARARTDALFVPYDMLIAFSFDFSSRRKRRWNMLPSQLHPSKKNAEAWWSAFEKQMGEDLPLRMRGASYVPQYRTENDLNLPPQRHFREVLLSEMKHQNRRLEDQIAQHVFANRYLTIQEALSLVEDPKEHANVESAARGLFDSSIWGSPPTEKLDRSDLLPSCFGILETINTTQQPCSECPLAALCIKFADKAVEATIQATGSKSPVLDADRLRGRDNVRNFRRKAGTLSLEIPV